MRSAPLFALIILGCGTGGAGDPSINPRPNPGLGTYDLFRDEDDRTVDLFPEHPHLGGPFALVAGDQVHLYLHRCQPETPCDIVRARSTDGVNFGPLTVFAESEDGLRYPYLQRTPTGSTLWTISGDGSTLLSYKITEDEPGEQAERLTVSGGRLRDPSVVDIAGTSYLYALFEDDDGTTSLDRRALEEGPIDHELPAEREVTDRLSLEVRRATSAADRETYRSLFSRSTGLGLSVSFDGVEWSVNPYNPVVSGTPTLGSASQIRFKAQYLIYTEAGRGPLRILAAVNRSGHPSLSWPLLSELAPPPSDSPR